MEYAIIEASGRQHWIENGKFLQLNKLSLNAGTKVFINRPLLTKKGTDLFLGAPYLNQIKIEATIGEHLLGPKVIIYKMNPKKKYRRKNGFRQQLTRILINQIVF